LQQGFASGVPVIFLNEAVGDREDIHHSGTLMGCSVSKRMEWRFGCLWLIRTSGNDWAPPPFALPSPQE
jgi:hypothetical protein